MKRSLLLCSLLVLPACNLMQHDDDALVEALVGLHLAEARQARFDDMSPALRDSIITAAGFTTASFSAHMDALSTDLQRATLIYGRVHDSLSVMTVYSPDSLSVPR